MRKQLVKAKTTMNIHRCSYLIPKSVLMPEQCQGALNIVDYQLLDTRTVKAAPKLSKEEKGHQFTKSIINSLQVAEPIKPSYLGDDNTSNNNDSNPVKGSHHQVS